MAGHAFWYGSLDLETTVYETVCHWRRFLLDSFPNHDQEIVGERPVFRVACNALLIDLRDKDASPPELRSRTSYALCQRLGSWLVGQGQNGVLVHSARCEGVNGAIFRPERLSNVRDLCYLTYRSIPAEDAVTVERKPGQTWLHIRPSALACQPPPAGAPPQDSLADPAKCVIHRFSRGCQADKTDFEFPKSALPSLRGARLGRLVSQGRHVLEKRIRGAVVQAGSSMPRFRMST